MANSEIRTMLKEANIPFWKVADALGCHENTIIRRLRHELSVSDRERFENAIAEIKAVERIKALAAEIKANEKPSE